MKLNQLIVPHVPFCKAKVNITYLELYIQKNVYNTILPWGRESIPMLRRKKKIIEKRKLS